MLQAQMEQNNNNIRLLEEEKKLDIENISLKEKQLRRQIEKFIGAKIF